MKSFEVDVCNCSLCAISEDVSGESIAARLQLPAAEIVIKGTPTGQSAALSHPAHIARFASGAPPEAPLEEHLARILKMYEMRIADFQLLRESCRFAVYCSYRVLAEGGWLLDGPLLSRMAATPFEFVFNVSPLPSSGRPP